MKVRGNVARRRIAGWAGAVTVAAGLAVASGTGTAGATEPAPSPAVAHQAPKEYLCVDVDNVYYREGPGPNYRALGQVNHGQGVDFIENVNGTDGQSWGRYNLWGGAANVYIRNDLIGLCG